MVLTKINSEKKVSILPYGTPTSDKVHPPSHLTTRRTNRGYIVCIPILLLLMSASVLLVNYMGSHHWIKYSMSNSTSDVEPTQAFSHANRHFRKTSKAQSFEPGIKNDWRVNVVLDQCMEEDVLNEDWFHTSLRLVTKLQPPKMNAPFDLTKLYMNFQAENSKDEFKVPGSNVGRAKTYGNPMFGFINRERGNFARIPDGTSPRSTKLERKRGLLALYVYGRDRARALTLIKRFKGDRMDVLLFQADSASWNHFPAFKFVPSIRMQNQSKFWFAKRFLTPQMVENYDYIFLWDGSNTLPRSWAPARFVALLKEFHIHAAHPAFFDAGKGRNSQDSMYDISRDEDVVHGSSEHPGRFAQFVGSEFPVFSREAWQHCIWETIPYDDSSFDGLETTWYPHCASAGYCRFAVIDSMPIGIPQVPEQPKSQPRVKEYLELYKAMCAARPSQVMDNLTVSRILTICAYFRTYPMGHPKMFLDEIHPIHHSGNRAKSCMEPDLWPGLENNPWFGNDPILSLMAI